MRGNLFNSSTSTEERAFANCKSAQCLPAQVLMRLRDQFPTSINNMVQNNLKSSRSFQLNHLIEHQRDRKLSSALIYLKSANTHEYFIKLLLFKYKSRQNTLLLLTVNGDGTQFCRTALLSCVRRQSHQLQKRLHWVTAVAFNTFHLYFHANPIQYRSVTRLLLHSLWVKERFTALYLP